MKQNQPQPILPNKGEIKINEIQMIITKVMTPQYIECQIKPIAKTWKNTGVNNKKITLDIKLNENSFFMPVFFLSH